jgi:hypothetical protein
MRTPTVWSVFWLAFLWGAQAAPAQELETTVEFGITITPDNITDAIQETQDFWSPVLKYIASNDFPVNDAAARKEAANFFNRLHDSLYKRLFEGDEASARDLLDYLCLRMRKIIIYRQLRDVLADDAALSVLIDRWEKAHREISGLAEAERPARVKAVLALIPEETAALGISADASTRAMQLWEKQAECMGRMSRTGAGTMIAGFEHEAKRMDRPIGELLRSIAAAADWSLITKAGTRSAGRAEFEKSWKDLAEMRERRLSAARPVTAR